ncbi:hypothetical protein BDD12DRAFT_879490 [Trichophaea hybrida]|nr:hypothetical protein BDD12DRAFT_879490 [Trichophaea hybrida]
MYFFSHILVGSLLSFAACAPSSTAGGEIKSSSTEPDIKTLVDTAKITSDLGDGLNDTATAFGQLICETSWASPTFSEIDTMTKWLDNAKKTAICAQTNPGGSKCTTHSKFKGGALAVCGVAPWSVKCHELSWAGKKIKNECGNQQMGRAGGIYIYDDNLRAVLY